MELEIGPWDYGIETIELGPGTSVYGIETLHVGLTTMELDVGT